MINQEALDQINELMEERNKWEHLFIDLMCAKEDAGFVHIKTPELSTDEIHIFIPEDLLPRVIEEVKIIDEQLIKLGFQPSPLDLKEGEKK